MDRHYKLINTSCDKHEVCSSTKEVHEHLKNCYTSCENYNNTANRCHVYVVEDGHESPVILDHPASFFEVETACVLTKFIDL